MEGRHKYPNGATITRGFDPTTGLWTSVKDWNAKTATFGYTPDGRLATTTYPNGVTQTATYDASGNPSLISVTSGATPLGAWGYTRNAVGDVTAVDSTTVGTDQTYGYDNLYRQTGLSDTTDASNNATYTYNTAGDRTTAGTTTYSYNNRGQLTAAGTASYTYDPDGLRLTKTVTGTTTTFAWDDSGTLPLLLQDGSNYYVYGPDGAPIERLGPTPGDTRWLHHDQQESIRVATNPTGNVTTTNTYTPWGTTQTHTGETINLGYTSQYTDPETGYIYLRARYYDPTTAQFLTRDPLDAVTRSPYGYVANNPLNATDPTGLWCPLGKNPNGSCRGSGVTDKVGDLVVATRNAPVTAMTTTANVVTGGSCRLGRHLTVVCEGGALSDLGDTAFTTGNTVNVSTGYAEFFKTHPEVLQHEWGHSRQWAVLGPMFLPLYGLNLALSDAVTGEQCWNVFEWKAGFRDGHYPCSGFGCRR